MIKMEESLPEKHFLSRLTDINSLFQYYDGGGDVPNWLNVKTSLMEAYFGLSLEQRELYQSEYHSSLRGIQHILSKNQ